MDDIKVTIVCMTYNHEKYIKDALDSFLMQKTNFKYEVIVHDDASTDGTPDIVREYVGKYPDIIKPILQKENIYSQRIPIYETYILPKVRGMYIAYCEGDDYWTDSNKLQKQVDILDSHPEVDICAHSAFIVEADSKKKKGCIKPSNSTTILPLEQVIYGGGGYVATNSLMHRFNIDVDMPEFRSSVRDDYSLQIHGSLRGGMYYLCQVMSAYRYMADNSWSRSMANNIENRKKERDRIVKLLDMVDSYTNYKYTDIIRKRLVIENALILELENKCSILLTKEYKNAWESYSNMHKLKIIIKAVFPFLHNFRNRNKIF